MRKCKWWMLVLLAAAAAQVSEARIKLVALPDRGDTVIRLDNPAATLIEEERVLTLQKGVNKVDFAWNGVSLDVDSIRLTVLSHPEQVKLLNVSYPPNEQALVWELASPEALEVKARISYLLNGIDRLITYKAVADKEETQVDLKSHLVLRNFSGEDFTAARVLLNYGEAFEQGIQHEETKQLLFMKQDGIPIEKIWTFDAAKKPWDPQKVSGNVGIPVTYKIKNEKESKLGENSLWDGKVRVYQDDGHEGTIFLGEDNTALVPVGEEMEVYVGDSRDLVITQRKMQEKQVNIRRNNSNHIVLYDTDEIITAKIENFKDKLAKLLLIQHIPGQWEMEKCSMEYERKDAGTLEFTVELKPQETRELTMHYHRRNVR